MLLYCKAQWDSLTVVWCDSGDTLAETLELIDRVQGLVPNFLRIAGDSWGVRKQFGWPSDLLLAEQATQLPKAEFPGMLRLQSKVDCCAKSIMFPLHLAMKELGFTRLLRGQKNSDWPRSSVKSGEVIDGILIEYPLAEWSDADVNEFLRKENWALPGPYAFGLKSLPDCVTCTAWQEVNSGKFLRSRYPTEAALVESRLEQIRTSLTPAMLRLLNIS